MENHSEIKPEKMKDLALDYLNGRYDDTFTALSFSDSNWSDEHVSVLFSSQRYGGNVEVRIWSGDDGYTFADNYFKHAMLADAQAYFAEMMTEVPAQTKVRFLSDALPAELGADSTFAQLVASGKCNVEVYYITAEAVDEAVRSALAEQVAASRIMGFVQFATTDRDDLLAECPIDQLGNTPETSVDKTMTYYINSAYQIDAY